MKLGGGVGVLRRSAEALEIAGKGGVCTRGAALVRGQDQCANALLALASAQREVNVRHNDRLTTAESDLVGEQEILKRVSHAAVTVDGEGALGGTLGSTGAGSDVGVVAGGYVQSTAVLLNVIGADDPIAFDGLIGGVRLDGEHKVICGLNALIGCARLNAKKFLGLCHCFQSMLRFYVGGEAATPEARHSISSSAGSYEIAFDYASDAPYIVAAFQQTYGIDLTTSTMHWWRFRALFLSLPEDTLMHKIMCWRTADLSGMQSEERQRYELLRGAYALPAEVKGGRRIATVADHDAAFLARFQHTGE